MNKYHFLFAFVIVGSISIFSFANGRQLRVYLYKVDQINDHDYFKVDVRFQNNSEHHIILDMDLEALKDIDDSIAIEIEAYMKQPDGEYIRLLRTPTRHLCSLFANPELEPLFMVAFDGLKHHGNIVEHCPYKKGHYTLKGYKIDPAKLPDMAIPGDFRTDMDIFVTEGGKQKLVLKFMWYSIIEEVK